MAGALGDGSGWFHRRDAFFGFEVGNPGAVFDLIVEVAGLVVGRTCLPHLEEDLQPALTKTAQGAGMALTLLPMGSVVFLGPLTGLAT